MTEPEPELIPPSVRLKKAESESKILALEQQFEEFMQTRLKHTSEMMALTDLIAFIAEKAKLDVAEVMQYWDQQKKKKHDELLQLVENKFPDRAAQLDRRGFDELPEY